MIQFNELGIYGIGHSTRRRGSRNSVDRFLRATEEATVNDYAAATKRRHTMSNVRGFARPSITIN